MATKILLLSANPIDTARLQLGKEFNKIKKTLKRVDEFEIEQSEAVSIHDIRRDVSEYKPNIVHFSGHGDGQAGLMVEDETGNSQLLSSAAISEFLTLYKDSLCT